MSLYQGIGSDIKGGLVVRTNQILREQADQRGGMIGGKEGTAGYWKKGSGGGGSACLDPRVQYERPYWQGKPAPTEHVFDAGESVYRKPVYRVDVSGGFPKLITNKRRVIGKGFGDIPPPYKYVNEPGHLPARGHDWTHPADARSSQRRLDESLKRRRRDLEYLKYSGRPGLEDELDKRSSIAQDILRGKLSKNRRRLNG